MTYLEFVRAHPRFLAFGFSLTLFSSFGQTFFISLFGADLRATFDLSHGGFGSVYSLATLASGLTLIWLGRKIDFVDLRLYAALVCAGLAGACFLFARVPSVALLPFAIYALRLSAQGLMGHTAATSMARYFQVGRGKAIAIAMLGYPAGEAIFPVVAVALNARIGWRDAWTVIAGVLAVVLVPWILWLLRGHTERHRAHVDGIAERDRTAAEAEDEVAAPAEASEGKSQETGGGVARDRSATHRADRQWRRRDVLRDVRFYLVMPAVLAPMFILTGLFFHQVHLASEKGWTLEWLATCFVGYAAAHLVGSLVAGPLVDRFGAPRLLPFFLAPLGLGLAALATSSSPWIALAYLVPAGITGGAGGTIGTAFWAEVYGVAHLGSIRALAASLSVFSTAASPVTMGRMIDAGVSMEAIAWMCVAYVVAGSALTTVAFRGPAAQRRRWLPSQPRR